MNYSEIKYCDIANGDGVRTSLFVSGCTHHCAGCFQPQTWSFNAGKPFDDTVESRIITSVEPSYISGLSVLGGEPMEPANQYALAPFLERLKAAHPEKSIWCFTGDVLEDLLDKNSMRHTNVTMRLLACIDVLVDGPFVQDLHDITLRFCGSSNQRLIDMPATLAASDGTIVRWHDDPLFSTHTFDQDFGEQEALFKGCV